MISRQVDTIMPRSRTGTRGSWVLTLTALVLGAALAQAQTFTSTSTGADGALNYSGTPAGTVVIFDPATHQPPLDVDGDNIYHFTTINIPADVTVKLTSSKLNFAPVYWLASDLVRIDGTLDLSGDPGHAGGLSATRTVSLPGPGGFPGGVGGSADSAAIHGFGPGASGYGGSYGTAATYASAANIYGNLFILPLIGGSGGSGLGAVGTLGGGGGAGGGAILIASSVYIRVNGTIRSDGGTGGAGAPGASVGCGGSGGAVRLLAPLIYGTGSVSVAGGPGGPGATYYSGGLGRVRLEAFRFDSIPAITGSYRVVTLSPEAIFLPTHGVPSVRVTTLDGEAVPTNPTGSFLLPDMTINKSTPVTLAIQAKNIPLGTQINVSLFSESGEDQLLTSTPLSGTVAASVAEASGTLPPGFSRVFVRASWTPAP